MNRNRLLIAISLAFLILGKSSYAIDFNLKLSGGLNFINSADISRILNDRVEWQIKEISRFSNWYLIESAAPEMKNAIEFEGEFFLRLHSRIAVSLSSGFILGEISAEKTEILYHRTLGDFSRIKPQKVSAVPLVLSGYYFLPLFKNFKVYARGGGGLIWAKYIDRQASKKAKADNYGYSLIQNTSARSPIFCASLGVMFETEPGINFFLEGSYRQARISGFTGEIEDGLSGTLYYYEEYDEKNDYWQAKMEIKDSQPAGDIYRSVRKGEVDLSGFSLKLGILLKF